MMYTSKSSHMHTSKLVHTARLVWFTIDLDSILIHLYPLQIILFPDACCIRNHTIGYNCMTSFCNQNVLRQAYGLCHSIFSQFVSSDESQYIGFDAAVSSSGNI